MDRDRNAVGGHAMDTQDSRDVRHREIVHRPRGFRAVSASRLGETKSEAEIRFLKRQIEDLKWLEEAARCRRSEIEARLMEISRRSDELAALTRGSWSDPGDDDEAIRIELHRTRSHLYDIEAEQVRQFHQEHHYNRSRAEIESRIARARSERASSVSAVRCVVVTREAIRPGRTRQTRRVVKTAAAPPASGDPEPEPPSDRRALAIGGAP